MYSPGTLLPPSRNSPSTFPWMRSRAASAWFLSFSTAPACSYSNHPVEVRSNLPPERLKSLHPSCCSRLWTWAVTVGCLREKCSAASEKLRSSATQ